MMAQPVHSSGTYFDRHGMAGILSDDDPCLDHLGPVPRWKRALDISLTAPALVLLLPVMAIAACLVFCSGRGPILFRQMRVGRGERHFTILKFRTMYQSRHSDAADREAYRRELADEATPVPDGHLFRPANDPRVTPVGRFLRQFSIDELPQLFNVLKGEMSLVGPRPALPWEAELFTRQQRRRHAALPGITGLWQVNGRNRCSSLDMLKFDLRYVEECSLKLDLVILLRTPQAVLFERYTR
jgi:lipopolysaccharide/colanic/teichoic acid biosynthesis glycosyltransferase